MKITLIGPPLGKHNAGNQLPPLGLAYLASVLEKKKHTVRIIEPAVLGWSTERTAKEIINTKPDMLGLSGVSADYSNSLKISRLIKETLKIPSIIGGAHASSQPEEICATRAFEVVVVGEGEETVAELADYYSENKPKDKNGLEGIKGIVFINQKGETVTTEKRPLICNLDTIPYPAYHLLQPLKKYRPSPGSWRKFPVGSIMTSRGCPNECIFCSNKVFGRTTRFRSAKSVVDEIEILINNYNAKEIRIWDDTFNLIPQRVEEICQVIKERGLKFSWTCQGRVNNTEERIFRKMREAGCWQIAFGIESGDQEMLEKMKKKITLEEVEKAVITAKKAGLQTKGFFIIGLPEETEQTIKKTVDLACQLPLDIAAFSLAVPYPGTQFFQDIKDSINIKEKQQNYLQFQTTQDNLPYIPEGLYPRQVVSWHRRAYRRFYLRPRIIIQQIMELCSFWKAKAAIRELGDIIKLAFPTLPHKNP